jgi:hypothetical protein
MNKKVITAVILTALMLIAVACNTYHRCPAYTEIPQEEAVENV